MNYKLAVFTDEISQDLAKALAVAKEFNIPGVEIRSVWEHAPHLLSDSEVSQIGKAVKEAGMKVACVASPMFKCELDDKEAVKTHLGILDRCLEVAERLEAKVVRGFTFWKRKAVADVWDEVLKEFEPVKARMKGSKIFLGIENEYSVYISKASDLKRFLDTLDCPEIRGIWDPANMLFDPDGEKVYPDAYQIARPYMVHMHLKDAVKDAVEGKSKCVPIGDGEALLAPQLKALDQDGYSGYISLETHWRPTKLDEETLRKPGGAEFSESGEFASRVCLENLMRILKQQGIQ